MLPSHQVRTLAASLLLVVATLVVVVPSAGLWKPPLDARFASHALAEDGPETAAGAEQHAAGLHSERSDRLRDDRPGTPSDALQRSDLLVEWLLLVAATLAALFLAPRAGHGWSAVRSHLRAPRRAAQRGTRSWRAPPLLV
jgi:hypothetical protein